MFKLKQHNYFIFELWIILRTFPLGLTSLADTLLVTDKLCLQNYHESAEFCQNISKTSASQSEQIVRDFILSESAKFSVYQNLIQCIPMVIWSFFIGSFLDKFQNATKFLLVLGLLGDIVSNSMMLANTFFFNWNPYFILLPSLTYCLTGGMANLFTVSYRYIVITTTQVIRSIKFMLFSFVVFLGTSLGNLAAGILLMTRFPSSKFPQVRTYHYNYLLALAFDIVCLVVVLKLESANKQTEDANPTTSSCESIEEVPGLSESTSILDPSHNLHNYQTINNKITQVPESSVAASQKEPNFFAVLFDFSNVRETIFTLIKPRENHIRLAIYTLIGIYLAYIFINFGLSEVIYQFCEKVYNWGPAVYSKNKFIVNVIQTTCLTFAFFFLVSKLTDESLLMMSIVSYFGQQIVMGTVLNEYAYFGGQFIGSLNGFASIAVRNKISKLILFNEVGKVFSLFGTLEAIMPFLGASVYSNIFSATIATYSGSIFLLSALIMVGTLGACVFLELYCKTKYLSI